MVLCEVKACGRQSLLLLYDLFWHLSVDSILGTRANNIVYETGLLTLIDHSQPFDTDKTNNARKLRQRSADPGKDKNEFLKGSCHFQTEILHTTRSSSKAAFLNDGGSLHQRSVLLVIAHPDDESMFFTPTINYLTSRGHNLHIICMSTGNADGMGNIRKEELLQASAVLKIPLPQVKILDHPDLQDGFGKVWNSELLASIVDEYILSHAIDLVITFDNYGISGHCNHRDLNRGIRKLLHKTTERNIEAWELISINIFRKYSGPVDICLSLISAMFYQNGELHYLLNECPSKSYNAMAQHRSQWIWFRKLFVVFSSYTYVNTLKKIN